MEQPDDLHELEVALLQSIRALSPDGSDDVDVEMLQQIFAAQIESRAPTFKLTSTRLVVKPGFRGVEVVGTGTNLTNGSIQRSMRSLHAYGHGLEVVLDAFAPPRDFARVDEQTFGPMARSLRLIAPRASTP